MNGYATVTIGEKPVELFFGYTAHRSLIEGARAFRDQYLTDDSGLTDFGYAKLLLAAYENNCMNKNTPPKLRFDDFMEYIDTAVQNEAGVKEFGAAIAEWAASKETQKMMASVKTAPEKKSEPLNQSLPQESISTTTSEPVLES
jgi:hypothetical protein